MRQLDFPTPEKPEALTAQLEAFLMDRRLAVLLTPGEAFYPDIPNVERTPTHVGIFLHDPTILSKGDIHEAVSRGTYGQFLGHVEPKSARTTRIVVACDPSGFEIQASMVSPEKEAEQIGHFMFMYPRARIESGGIELAKRVIAHRKENH